MRDMPAAEIVVDEVLVRGLLQQQHPDLAGLPLSLLANGWDNVVLRLGDSLLVRVPRRAAAAPLLANEQRWLPVVGAGLPVPVPVPLRVGTPAAGYPWPWSVTAYLRGEVAARTPLRDHAAVASTLGLFLARLHRPAPVEAPTNPLRGVPLAARSAVFEESLRALGSSVDTSAVRSAWEAALSAPPWRGPALWLHGDLHPANILVRRGRVSAVIDFGDLTSGDPATDLAVGWMILPRGDRDLLWDTYAEEAGHTVDDALRVRARGWAAALGSAFLANSADNALIAAVGRTTLDEVVRA